MEGGSEAAGDESESTDEEEMGSMMAKLLAKQFFQAEDGIRDNER
eukprot:COSAG06_NODE_65095_length_258_cov_0.421384_1_plen_45_part_00